MVVTYKSFQDMGNSISLSNLPVIPPPPGVVPNFTDPVSRAFMINIVSAVCLPLFVIFAGFRLYARTMIIRSQSWADGTISSLSSMQVLTFI